MPGGSSRTGVSELAVGAVAVGLMLSIESPAAAQRRPAEEADAGTPPTGVELVPAAQAEQRALDRDLPAAKPFSLYAGVNFVSMYVSRGQVFSSKFSVQPWVELDVPLAADPDRFVTGVSAFAGNWNSIQEGDPGLGQARSGNLRSLDNWYEADLYAGLRLTLREHWLTSLRFNYYTSPSDSFNDLHEIDWRVRYDDAAFWADRGVTGFSLQPALRIAKEARDRAGATQWYFSPSLSPNYTVTLNDWPLTFTVPLVLGFGADGQYVGADGEEEHFGFFQTGLTVSAPLDLLPEDAGAVRVSGGLDVIVVSDEAINFRDEQVELVGKFGLTYSY